MAGWSHEYRGNSIVTAYAATSPDADGEEEGNWSSCRPSRVLLVSPGEFGRLAPCEEGWRYDSDRDRTALEFVGENAVGKSSTGRLLTVVNRYQATALNIVRGGQMARRPTTPQPLPGLEMPRCCTSFAASERVARSTVDATGSRGWPALPAGNGGSMLGWAAVT